MAIATASGLVACGPARAPDHGTQGKRDDGGPTYLVLRLSERRLYLMSHDPAAPVESFPIAIGREGHDTPTGQFRVEEIVEHPDYGRSTRTIVLASSSGFPRDPTIPLANVGWGSRTATDGRSASTGPPARSCSVRGSAGDASACGTPT
jgi:hypothetical protein